MLKHKNSKTKNNNDEESFVFHWKEMLGGFLAGFTKSVTDSVIVKIRTQIDNGVRVLKRNAMGMTFILAGSVFLLIALASFIDQFTGVPGSGYSLVGFFALILGLIIIKQQ